MPPPSSRPSRQFRAGPYEWRRIEPGLEDVFIHLMDELAGQRASHEEALAHFSSARFWAIVVKEFVQMRRDRLTFGMMVGIPLLQLILFGYAINSDPKHLPAAVLLADDGPQGRTLLYAMREQRLLRLRRAGGDRIGGARRAGARRSAVRRQHPAEFYARPAARRPARRSHRGGRRPIPAATSNALGALRAPAEQRAAERSQGPARLPGRDGRPDRLARPRALQPRSHHPVQHRPRPAGRRPHDDHGHDHGAGDHPRARTRHHGEPALHAHASRSRCSSARSFPTSSSATSRWG